MFKNHPKGLLPAALANMGERFGFYTMMAILTLFLMSKFGLDKTRRHYLFGILLFDLHSRVRGRPDRRQDQKL